MELEERPSLDLRLRITELLHEIGVGKLPQETLQRLRAIEVLERIGTPDAVRCLERLAAGTPDAWETRTAKAAVARLGKRDRAD